MIELKVVNHDNSNGSPDQAVSRQNTKERQRNKYICQF